LSFKPLLLDRSYPLLIFGNLLAPTDVLGEVGVRTGIPPFYVSFVIAPVASNASELIASYSYALKKTPKSISIALQALQGAACMNNTFCLSIFMALIYFLGLAWEYTAETVAIVLCQLGVAVVSALPNQVCQWVVGKAVSFPHLPES
jgi:Ca2+/Na+ antiporter